MSAIRATAKAVASNPKTTLSAAVAGVLIACGQVWPEYERLFTALAAVATAIGLFLAADSKAAK